METICLYNQKGGSGKTTTTVLLAVTMALMTRRRVAVLDRDPQGTITWLLGAFKKEDPDLRLDVNVDQKDSDKYDTLFIDVAGYAQDREAKKTVGHVDKIIIVTTPSFTDLKTTQRAIEDARAFKKPEAKMALLFTRVRANTRETAAIDDLTKRLGVDRLQATLRDAQRYHDLGVFGRRDLDKRDYHDCAKVLLELNDL
jgi:chromosome partitioning protein